ncbi:methyltransferase domain-containing protein [Candidatus Pacearchaeota archaeon]|nr:methyltransferase domain-containing protein [Candidatus Pacearchaeota archaeon]
MAEKAFDMDYAKYYDIFNQGKNYEQEAEFLDRVFKKYSKNQIKTILNLGCGTGMHDIELSKEGYSVMGLDLSADMIEIAKSRNIPNTEFVVGNMSNFSLNNKFGACISMFATFGYQLENKDIKSSFECIKNHLLPGGLVIIEVWNGLGVLRELPSSRKKEIIHGDILIKRQSFPVFDAFNHKVDINFKVDIFKNNESVESYEEMHKMRFFFPQEFIKYVEDAGFEVLEICDTFKLGSKVNENNWNMVLIARLK